MWSEREQRLFVCGLQTTIIGNLLDSLGRSGGLMPILRLFVYWRSMVRQQNKLSVKTDALNQICWPEYALSGQYSTNLMYGYGPWLRKT